MNTQAPFPLRIRSLLAQVQPTSLAAVAINPGPTLTYLTGLGFHLMERPTVLIISREGAAALILPELEMAKTVGHESYLRTFPFGDNPEKWGNSFKAACAALHLTDGEVGIEPTAIRYLELHSLSEAMPAAKFVSAAPIFASLRMCKDEEEITRMRHAVAIAQRGLADTLPLIRPGVREREIAATLTMHLLKEGSDPEMPFAPIVSSGPNSANPHASPSERELQVGDLLVIDWGAAYLGYVSDLTRTFAIGEVEPEFRHIHEIVRQANEVGRATGKPGLRAGEVDLAAREMITAAGYGPYFTHRVGHGLGMEGHEEPYMFAENTHILAPGNTYTIEPGIYLPGRGGVRIEDDVVVTAAGSETLSDFDRQLITLPRATLPVS